MPVYVVVHVTYDYYRFQENLWATTDANEARAYADNFVGKRRDWGHIPVMEDEQASQKMDDVEHVLIETFNP